MIKTCKERASNLIREGKKPSPKDSWEIWNEWQRQQALHFLNLPEDIVPSDAGTLRWYEKLKGEKNALSGKS